MSEALGFIHPRAAWSLLGHVVVAAVIVAVVRLPRGTTLAEAPHLTT